jgi:hypothetical protein
LGFGCLLRDQQFEPVAEDRTVCEVSAKLAAAAKLPNAVGKLAVTALPRDSELTLQIKDVRQGKIGFSRQTINLRDFSSRDLMISDIQLLTEIVKPEQQQIFPTALKQDQLVAPYPFEKIRQSIPLLCYFEIYNLKSSGITDNYEVVYKIVSEKSKANILKQVAQSLASDKDVAISVSYTRPVTDDAAQELIAIDLSKVPKGAHRLEIEVADTKNAKIKTSAEREIIIDN